MILRSLTRVNLMFDTECMASCKWDSSLVRWLKSFLFYSLHWHSHFSLSLHGKCFSVLDTAKVASLLVKPTIVCPTLIQGKRDGEATESHKEAVDALLFLSASKTSSGTQAVGSDNIENRKRASEDETPSQSHPTCNSAPDAGRGGKKAKTLEQEFEWSSSQPSAIPRGSYKCSRCGKPKRGHRCNLPESHMQTVFKQAQQPNKLVTESKKAPVAVLPAHPLVQVPVLGQFSASSRLQNVDPNSSVAADALASKKNYKPGAFSSQVACALFIAGCSSTLGRNSQSKQCHNWKL